MQCAGSIITFLQENLVVVRMDAADVMVIVILANDMQLFENSIGNDPHSAGHFFI